MEDKIVLSVECVLVNSITVTSEGPPDRWDWPLYQTLKYGKTMPHHGGRIEMVVKFIEKKSIPHVSLKPGKNFPRMGEGNFDQKDQVKANRVFSPEYLQGFWINSWGRPFLSQWLNFKYSRKNIEQTLVKILVWTLYYWWGFQETLKLLIN